ncbi:DNA-binding transcriptional regulator, MarR family [Tessaracoccus bendigoensis DSM 12906]|uniref:DNA-binding transcriptional regulator, MarR family n=1 Tax=Tessaracoccus bendigoensis DSM 12906 TaxID=1123357 RepID=A0A1M6JXR0_9ACTN|nr:MarR family transcriptional regulator [Tessaracoccus bendigoensis]SHJ51504.1 DNA-binding transcriptional regulator, MarR family [Tessaracoccus bendigoensis DSM 12906]
MIPDPESGGINESLYDVQFSDPDGVLVDRSSASPADLAQVTRIMTALVALRDAEESLAEASSRYMLLNRTDMRALHFLIVSQNLDEPVTPGALASHLGISTASTTKLLDRLERGGHVVREPHPTDRRALIIRITPETRAAAMETVGRQQARRFNAAARLSPGDREVVIGFLEDMAKELSVEGISWADPG